MATVLVASLLAATAGATSDVTAGAVETPPVEDAPRAERLKRLSLEELMTLEVSSVSKRPERQFHAAAAVSVITGEDIKRAGARTLADALRLAPGVHVSRIDSGKWAVGIRGFANRFSRSLLVLLDGRSVYTPLFAGTYWEVQDLLLEDVERIEVIRGPGGTLWGANAYSGVINIISKSAHETRGELAQFTAGTEERFAGAYRHGGGSEDGRSSHRIWVKSFERDAGFREDGIEYDDWGMTRVGLRWDAHDEERRDSLTAIAGGYEGRTGERSDIVTFGPPFLTVEQDDSELSGAHALGRWTRALDGGGELAFQGYFDWTYRHEPTFREKRHTYDLDFQHRLGQHGSHSVIWGAGYRLTGDDVNSLAFLGVDPTHRRINLASAFIQDEVQFRDGAVRLIYGTKLEHDDLNDALEIQPNVRLHWTPRTTREQALWFAISRAVRTSSRIEEDLTLTQPPDPMTGVFPTLVGTGDFDAEELLAIEAGYRVRAASGLFLDFAVFHNTYENLLGFEPGMPAVVIDPGPPHVVFPLNLTNSLEGDAWGFEAAAAIELSERWRLHVQYSFIDLDLRRMPGSMDTVLIAAEGQTPEHQALLRSQVDLGAHWALDAVLRWTDDLPADNIPSYWSADVRLAWSPRPDLELAIVLHDILSEHHREFAPSSILSTQGGSDVERGIYGTLTWRH